MMMKKFLIIAGFITTGIMVISCDQPRRSPGRAYMPDMTYSRAYETYANAQERLKNSGVEGTKPSYNNRPVAGTMARGDMAPYAYKNDSSGYTLSANNKSPLDRATINMKESERLYLVNCAICHGSKLDGNGPLFKGGDGPYTAAPANLMSDEMKLKSEGTMFHVATYGKGQMGSYASQLSSQQRWMVVEYIKSKQASGGKAGAAVTDSTGAQKVDTTAAVAKTN
jgi:mono/diheme cytochrome c family protein